MLTEGIRPRVLTGKMSKWKHIPSSKDRVYLTEIYAPYYANAAAREGEKWGLIEVDVDRLDKNLLRPDEDFIAQALKRTSRKSEDLLKLTEEVRDSIDNWQALWSKSIEWMGTCSYKGVVPPEAIPRVAIYDPESNPTMTLAALDPSISIENYRICGDKYRAITRWFFLEAVAAEEILGLPLEVARTMYGTEEGWTAMQERIRDRKGIVVHEKQPTRKDEHPDFTV